MKKDAEEYKEEWIPIEEGFNTAELLDDIEKVAEKMKSLGYYYTHSMTDSLMQGICLFFEKH